MSQTEFLTKEITLSCHGCDLTVMTPRDISDPPHAVFMKDWCPKCGNGGFDQTEYFDENGKLITYK